MKATETQLRVLLEGQKQFRVPLFQRPYSWKRKHWQTLWHDLIETYGAPSVPHFLGPMVTKALPGTAEGVSPFLVIDGQQRLTTVSLLLAALRDHVAESKPELADKIHDLYLTNKWAKGPNTYKLLPTQADRSAYTAAVDRNEDELCGGIAEAYHYFRKKLNDATQPQEAGEVAIGEQKLESVLVSHVEIVSITLDKGDNEFRIFESLNAKGEPLTQADLIRNHFFMQIPHDQQDSVYSDLWLPMQERLGDALADYFRVQIQATGKFVREHDTYQVWKAHLAGQPVAALIVELEELNRESRYYQRLIEPDHEPNATIREFLRRLNRWRGRTAYPFLLNVYREFVKGAITTETFRTVMYIVESFQVRRYLGGVPTNQLNRLFLRLYHQLPGEMDLEDGVIAVLSEPSRRWPTDGDLRQRIPTFTFYVNGRPEQRRLVLETILGNPSDKEPVDLKALTIEHIMPQTLTDAWAGDLGEGARDVHRNLVHTLGNLTLTGYNPELSNERYSVKRELLRDSNLQVNRDIAREEKWRADEIQKRSGTLADRCIDVWEGPARDSS